MCRCLTYSLSCLNTKCESQILSWHIVRWWSQSSLIFPKVTVCCLKLVWTRGNSCRTKQTDWWELTIIFTLSVSIFPHLSFSLQTVISYRHPALKLSTRRELQSHSVIHPSFLSAVDRLCSSASIQFVWFPHVVSLTDNWPNRPERHTLIGSLSRTSRTLNAADSRSTSLFLFSAIIPRRCRL